MKSIFVCMLFSSCLPAFAQDGFNILYLNQYRDKDRSLLPQTISYTRLLFNDRYVYSYTFSEGTRDPDNGEGYPNNKLGHSVLNERGGLFHYYNLNIQKKKYWYSDTIRTRVRNWVFTVEEKKILGYSCRKAYCLNEYFLPTADSVKTWVADSVVVWYTDEIQPATNFYSAYSGIPGTVMEIHDQNKAGWYSRAIAVTRQAVYIRFPEADLIRPIMHTKHPK